jgi:hypothetical protein
MNLVKQALCLAQVPLQYICSRKVIVNVVLQEKANESRDFRTDQAGLGEQMMHVLGLHLA